MAEFPKLFVFDLDFTLWDCGGRWIDRTQWPFRREGEGIYDRAGAEFRLYTEVREILRELADAGANMALASRTTRSEWAEWLLDAWDLHGHFAFREIYPGSKVRHFENLRDASELAFEEIIFFDDEERNIAEVGELGVTAVHVSNGLDRATFERGLAAFRSANG